MGAYDGAADAIRNATFSPDTLADLIEGIKVSGGYTTTGSSNAYVITPSPACDSYETGQVFRAYLNHTNSGAATMQWDGSTAKTLVDRLGNAFTGGELISGAPHTFEYDGTDVRCLTAQVFYSTSEINTGLAWVDGKPIYRKTISIGSLPNTAVKNTAHSISTIETMTRVYGWCDDGTDYLSLPYTSATAVANSIELRVTSTNLVCRTGINRTSYTGYGVIEYTKV